MKEIIEKILFRFTDANLASETARNIIAQEIIDGIGNKEFKEFESFLQNNPTCSSCGLFYKEQLICPSCKNIVCEHCFDTGDEMCAV